MDVYIMTKLSSLCFWYLYFFYIIFIILLLMSLININWNMWADEIILTSLLHSQPPVFYLKLYPIRFPFFTLLLPPFYERHCRNMPFGGRARRGSRVRFPKEERCTESPPTFICGKRRKNRRKPVKTKILSSEVVFTIEEGISTSHICLKRQQPIF